MNARYSFLTSIMICIILSGIVFSQTQPIKVVLTSKGSELHAEIYPAISDEPVPAFILMHGYPGGEGDPLGLGKRLSALGIPVLVFNYRGTWSSEGEFSFENSMEDVASAMDFLKAKKNIERFNIDTTNIVIGGYSFGGAMALTAAINNPDIKRIISIAGADESVFGRKVMADPDFRDAFTKMLKETEYPKGPIRYDLESYMKFWLSNLDRYDQVKHADVYQNRDVLLIGGLDDTSVVIEEHMLPLYRKIRSLNSNQIEMIVLNTNHSFKQVRETLSQKIYTWIVNKEQKTSNKGE